MSLGKWSSMPYSSLKTLETWTSITQFTLHAQVVNEPSAALCSGQHRYRRGIVGTVTNSGVKLRADMRAPLPTHRPGTEGGTQRKPSLWIIEDYHLPVEPLA